MTNNDWTQDIKEMHEHYGVNKAIRELTPEKLKAFLQFRINFLQEELDELSNSKNGDDVVDALIDLCVVAIGTLNALDVDSNVAWQRVYEANMNKNVGVNSSRPNMFNLPDLVKPAGWVAPNHSDNIGLLTKIFD